MTKKKKTTDKHPKAKKKNPHSNPWVGQAHLYQPEDESIRKDF